MKTLLLIDANALIHRAFHALPPLTSPDGRPAQAIYGLSSILLKIWRDERPDYVAALFDRPEPTLRKQEYKEYKAQRPKAADELVTQIIEAHNLFSAFGIKTFEVPGHEADDLIGTVAEKFKKESGLTTVILTGDLDALQLVDKERVVVKTLKTGISNTIIYNEKAVITRYGLLPEELPDYKALVGDSSDNIPGIPGVGPKTATALLQKYHTLEKLYANLDKEPKIKEKFSAHKKDATLYKRLATINREAPLVIKGIEELTSSQPNPALMEYFRSFGFESLVKRAGGEAALPEPARKEEPQNLFSVAPKAPVNTLYIIDAGNIVTPKGELSGNMLKVGFGLKDVVKAVRSAGSDINGPYFDLGIGFWLLDADYKKYDPESAFKKFLKKEWQPTENALRFAHAYLQKEIHAKNLKKIFEGIEMPLIDVLADMERMGIGVQKPALQKLSKSLHGEINRLSADIQRLAGEKVNVNSPKQLAHILFEKLNISGGNVKRTATGQRSTNIETLAALKDAHPIIPLILQYREVFKLQSTYVKPILALTGEDGRLHTDYIQTGTATGRLSSQNPNLQNIPALGGMEEVSWARDLRTAFAAERGFSLIAFDYSQLELRILASLSGDKKMIAAFHDGHDVHAATASFVFKVPPEKVRSDMRRIAKALNFGIAYGMGARAFAQTSGLSLIEAKNFIENYFRTFPGIRVWQDEIKKEAHRNGFIKNENGRIRRLPAIRYGAGRLAAEAERAAVNMPIQSLNADILKLSMIKLHKKMKENPVYREKARLLLSIHDELLFEIHDDIINRVAPVIKSDMESIYKLAVPLIVNVKQGKTWGDLA